MNFVRRVTPLTNAQLKLGFEVSKTIDAPYAPGNRGLWRKAEALNRREFVVVGWFYPEACRGRSLRRRASL